MCAIFFPHDEDSHYARHAAALASAAAAPLAAYVAFEELTAHFSRAEPAPVLVAAVIRYGYNVVALITSFAYLRWTRRSVWTLCRWGFAICGLLFFGLEALTIAYSLDLARLMRSTLVVLGYCVPPLLATPQRRLRLSQLAGLNHVLVPLEKVRLQSREREDGEDGQEGPRAELTSIAEVLAPAHVRSYAPRTSLPPPSRQRSLSWPEESPMNYAA